MPGNSTCVPKSCHQRAHLLKGSRAGRTGCRALGGAFDPVSAFRLGAIKSKIGGAQEFLSRGRGRAQPRAALPTLC